jgi:putative lipoprotein
MACIFSAGAVRAESIQTKDSWFGKDKARHFLASALIGGGVSWVAHRHEGRNMAASLRTGAGVALSLGLAKECSDRRKPGGLFSWKDLTADALGAALGVFVLGKW